MTNSQYPLRANKISRINVTGARIKTIDDVTHFFIGIFTYYCWRRRRNSEKNTRLPISFSDNIDCFYLPLYKKGQ